MLDELDQSPYGERAPSAAVARIMGVTRRQPDNWLGRRIAYALRSYARSQLTGPVDTEAMGARFRLYPFTNVCEKKILFTPQFFDPVERDFIRSRLRPDFVFLDVGANIGGYSLAVAAFAGPQARIIAFEPQPQIFERLAYNIAQNPFGTIKAVACAVADHDGELTLFLNCENRGQASVKLVASEQSSGGMIKVPAKSLLSLLREEELTHVDAAKLDVEGAEDLIMEPFLRDAPKSLWPRLLLVENIEGRWHKDVGILLLDHGYRSITISLRNVAFELPDAT
ncbi:FkbM family methyltransferase [Labrys monachus]|uniref:FkbM family methyltransferase n=1 Tax=Labrys monachus TaxID=217067 RepID=A0ABU0FIR5_9HYPH|nr:FkbM family methyltransferase [Labrys monachus]MDQ0393993.1 FkbM family methyltransferase [Labrys monachus]